LLKLKIILLLIFNIKTKMKKILLFGAILSSLNSFSQDNYWAIKSTGTTAPYSMNDAAGTAIFTGQTATPVTSTLSSAINIPFSNWKFYGNTVTQFKVSSSGYITFDLTQTTDNTANTTLPNVAAPKSAIFAFWDNLSLQPVVQGANTFPSDVKTFTVGSSPNRMFVIQWRLAGTAGTSVGTNVTYFAIRLYEAGNFDVVHNYGFGTFTATMGVQDESQTKGFMLAGSPNKNFGGADGSYDETKSDVYKFNYGIQPNYEIGLNKITLPAIVKKATNTDMNVTVQNFGKTNLAYLKVSYSVDGGAPVTRALSTLNTINTGGLESFNFPTPLNFATSGIKTLKVWIDSPNQNEDQDKTNDTTVISVFVNNGIAATKRVFLEEGSGGWCGYCPDGHGRMKDILEANFNVNGVYNKVIGVVHHNADGMANTQSNNINTAYATGYPYGVVDRVLFNDQTTVGINRGLWATKVAERLNQIVPVNISITNKTFDPATRVISFKVKADFIDDAKPGDFRITAIISEDNVRGPMINATSTTWNQRNYFSSMEPNGGSPTSEFFSLESYMVGYRHAHVAKTVLPSAWGNAGVVPNAPALGSSYEQTFTYTLPALVKVSETDFPGKSGLYSDYQNTFPGDAYNKPNDIKIIGLISYYDNDAKKRDIINVNESPLLFGTSVKSNTKSAYITNLYPNPTSGLTQVDFNLSSTDNIKIEMFDISGKKVADLSNGSFAKGEHTVYFETTNFENGVYFVKVSSTEFTSTHKLSIQK
jgi:hypothetical protein